jgi:hypothetical protein
MQALKDLLDRLLDWWEELQVREELDLDVSGQPSGRWSPSLSASFPP